MLLCFQELPSGTPGSAQRVFRHEVHCKASFLIFAWTFPLFGPTCMFKHFGCSFLLTRLARIFYRLIRLYPSKTLTITKDTMCNVKIFKLLPCSLVPTTARLLCCVTQCGLPLMFHRAQFLSALRCWACPIICIVHLHKLLHFSKHTWHIALAHKFYILIHSIEKMLCLWPTPSATIHLCLALTLQFAVPLAWTAVLLRWHLHRQNPTASCQLMPLVRTNVLFFACRSFSRSQ